LARGSDPVDLSPLFNLFEKPEMKKTLIALAVLAASGASMAQVTLYGVADAAIGASDKVVAGSNFSLANENKWQVLANGNYTNGNSRWGMKGWEDLGGGLKAGFQFEGALNLTTGANQGSGGLLFSRTAVIKLAGAFGEINVGRQLTPTFNAMAAWDLVGTANYSVAQNQFNIGGPRDNAEISYATPDMGGFKVMLGIVPQGNAQYGTAADPKGKYDIAATYIGGPVSAGLGYNKVDSGNAGTTIGLAYNFGPVIVATSWNQIKTDAGDKVTEGWTLGASVPVGPWSFTLDVAQDTVNRAVSSNDTDVLFEAKYALSKRTFVYGIAVKDGKGKTAEDVNGWSIGMRHNF
jgi:predicted porin